MAVTNNTSYQTAVRFYLICTLFVNILPTPLNHEAMLYRDRCLGGGGKKRNEPNIHNLNCSSDLYAIMCIHVRQCEFLSCTAL